MKKLLFLFLALLCAPAYAIDKNPEAFASPEEEARYYDLIEELRCVVCQNQSLADSNAELAQDLRSEVRGLMDEGKDDKEIRGFLVERYGDFVLYNPPIKPRTLLLWGGPALLLLIAVIIIVQIVRSQRKTKAPQETELSSEERAKLQQVLDDKDIV
jgi:cytochrome c-type biogenesis protein CcmH